MMPAMSRVMFCPRCAEANNPFDGMYYAVYGSKSKSVWIFRYEAPTDRRLIKPLGFTPHFITVETRDKGYVHLIVACGVQDCDTVIRYNDGWKFDIKSSRKVILFQDDYEALCNFTDTGYKL